MKNVTLFTSALVLVFSAHAFGQSGMFKREELEAVGVSMSVEKLDGRSVVKVVKDTTVKAADEPTFVKMKGIDFQDGTIEVNVLSRLSAYASPQARGFIGVAFRIHKTNSKFECIYIRPTNGRADDQVRRNHSIQYFSFPDYKFNKLRAESPEMYEAYADMGLNEWIKLKIVVKGVQAKLYLNNSPYPSLIVNDLKLGESESGGIGLYVDNGTEGYFADLNVSK